MGRNRQLINKKDDIPIPETQLRIYNALAKKLGQKPIVRKKEAKKGWKIPLLGWTFGGGEQTTYGTTNVVRTGTYKGRKVVQYDDGRVEYADELQDPLGIR